MTFGLRMYNLLLDRDITQKQMAIDLNLPVSTLNGYITDRREPDYQMLLRISNYLHVTCDYLLGNTQTDLGDFHEPDLTAHDLLILHYYHELNQDQREQIDTMLKVMRKQNK